MNELASRGQLRLEFMRWALFTVPTILLLGYVSSEMGRTGAENIWWASLVKPPIMPTDAVYSVVWTTIYTLIALSFAMILNARAAAGRRVAIALFVVQLMLVLVWPVLFFRIHQVGNAFLLILVLILTTFGTFTLFRQIRPVAGYLLLPYLAWLIFAAYLNFEINRLNPTAETLVAPAFQTQI